MLYLFPTYHNHFKPICDSWPLHCKLIILHVCILHDKHLDDICHYIIIIIINVNITEERDFLIQCVVHGAHFGSAACG